MENGYTPGQIVKLKIVLTDTDGDAIDPDNVILNFLVVGGAAIPAVTYAGEQIQREDTGVYFYLFDTTNYAGKLIHYRWTTTGDVVTARDGSIFVNATKFTLT